MERWEYMWISLREVGNEEEVIISISKIFRYSGAEAVLNNLGEEGWEVVIAENWDVLLKRKKA